MTPMATQGEHIYVCIDLKSFYASVECADRGLDPFTTNLVVADPDRTEKTICLAITPAMKAQGVRNRCRVFEIPANMDYIMAKPRMKHYMEVSAQIYSVYLRYVSAGDVHVYSIDECFINATPYLNLYHLGAREFAQMLIDAVFAETHICATAGIGTNLFLAKVALDVCAKHAPDGIGYLDGEAFKRDLWFHRPITDIWNIGPGIARRLEKYGVFDLAGVAAMNPATLYREFGKNAEFLIDHAWGQEPCTIAEIKSYKPQGHSLANGQVLPCDYSFEEARMVLREMVDASVLDLIEQRLVCQRISLHVGYAKQSVEAIVRSMEEGRDATPVMPDADAGVSNPRLRGNVYAGHTGGSRKLSRSSNSLAYLADAVLELYDETTRRNVPIRRLSIGFDDLIPEKHATMTLFDDVAAIEKERDLQRAVLAVRGKFGKNAMLKGTSLKEKATARERNEQVGGHHA